MEKQKNKLRGALRGKKYGSGDEYYTRKVDIEKCLPYWDLSNKVVYCPCDSDESEFVNYFKQKGKCKELIYTSDDFRTHEDLFEKADIIVTNPPFSLKIAFLNIIRKYKKEYILILSNISLQNFPIEELNTISIFGRIEYFNTPENRIKHISCKWYSNLELPSSNLYTRHKMSFSGKHRIAFSKKDGKEYKYYNWADIPKDISGEFLVPITYDNAYKKYFPTLEILEQRDDIFDKETNKKCFERFLVRV